MVDVALGFSIHTGWAASVALAEWKTTARVVDRRRLTFVERDEHDARFVYHAAADLDARAAAEHVATARDIARAKAFQELSALRSDLSAAGYAVSAAGLPSKKGAAESLSEILRSHTRIHTAEGELFCSALVDAAVKHGWPVVAVPSRERLKQAARATGWRTERVKACVARLGRTLGPPWAVDQKEAALAALIAGIEATSH
jgi:hypothetical protein